MKSRRIGRGAIAGPGPFALTLLWCRRSPSRWPGSGPIADIVGPVFLALVLTVTLHPIRVWLETGRLPSGRPRSSCCSRAYLMLFLLTLALIVSVAQLAALIPSTPTRSRTRSRTRATRCSDLGVEQDPDRRRGRRPSTPASSSTSRCRVLSGTLGRPERPFFLLTVLLFMAFDTDSTRRSLAAVGTRFPDPWPRWSVRPGHPQLHGRLGGVSA